MEAEAEAGAPTLGDGASSTMMRVGEKLVLACSAHRARTVTVAMEEKYLVGAMPKNYVGLLPWFGEID
jgi:hypothetical protein